ncbi:MAG: hypothetical protein JWQ76_189 [Ramlibacter sp.]|nr:hypothetical protein [Ramlibacter sp.]
MRPEHDAATQAADAAVIVELRAQLAEAQTTLDAIRHGDVDAVLVQQGGANKIFTLVNADRPYRFLIEQMTEGAVTLSEEGVILYGNGRLAEILGAPLEKVVGNHLRHFLAEGEWPRFEALLAAPRSGPARGEFAVPRSGGGALPIYVSINDIVSDQGAPRLIGGVVTDLSLQQEMEARLRQAQKMEAVGQLTAGLAHDFNNLLHAVSANLDLIKMHPGDGPGLQRWARNGLRAAARGTRLTAQLLAFSKSQRLHPKPLDVTAFLREMSELLANTMGSGVALEYDLDSPSVSVLADRAQLELALLNLAINARDAMRGRGGVLRISTRVRRVQGDVELADGQYLDLSVADAGCGMSEETRLRAFDPFFSTKAVGAGTGLGLAQVYGIARQAGGAARIVSKVGAGTTATILLRLSGPALPLPELEAVLPPAGAPQSLATKVLVVDDDDDVRAVLVESLRLLGYDASEAADGAAGLAMMAAGVPDILVIDFAMPRLNGAEVVKRARASGFNMPVIFASGYSNTAALSEAVGPNANLLVKPFPISALAQEIDRLMVGAREALAVA